MGVFTPVDGGKGANRSVSSNLISIPLKLRTACSVDASRFIGTLGDEKCINECVWDGI